MGLGLGVRRRLDLGVRRRLSLVVRQMLTRGRGGRWRDVRETGLEWGVMWIVRAQSYRDVN